MRYLLLLAFLMPLTASAGLISFKADFPDSQLRSRTYEVLEKDHDNAVRLRSLIYLKEKQIVDHVRSCSPNSKNWKQEAQRWNELRAENWVMIKELRAIVARGY